MLTPEQSRAARGWLDWKQSDLAEKAKVGLSTIRDFEKGRRKPIENNMLAIARAFAEAGVTLVSDEKGRAAGISVGAKLKNDGR